MKRKVWVVLADGTRQRVRTGETVVLNVPIDINGRDHGMTIELKGKFQVEFVIEKEHA